MPASVTGFGVVTPSACPGLGTGMLWLLCSLLLLLLAQPVLGSVQGDPGPALPWPPPAPSLLAPCLLWSLSLSRLCGHRLGWL